MRASEEQVGHVRQPFQGPPLPQGHRQHASRSPRPSERTQFLTLLFSGLAFISSLEDSLGWSQRLSIPVSVLYFDSSLCWNSLLQEHERWHSFSTLKIEKQRK